MKKTIATLSLILAIDIGATAQNGGGLFQRGPMREDNNYDRTEGSSLLGLPSVHGSDTDSDVPLGSGMAVLLGMGAAYLMGKKHREE